MKLAKAPREFVRQKIKSVSTEREMRLYLPLSTIFLIAAVSAIAEQGPVNVPFVIKEPMGPKSNGPLHLDQYNNMDHFEKPVQLNLEWEYESSTVKNDMRSINKKQIKDYSSLRFVFETYNHDGWVIFGQVY